MTKHECLTPIDDCKYRGTAQCLITNHHLYWPKPDYTTHTEKAFRELPENKVPLPRCLHDLEHLQAPPDKPDLIAMKIMLGELAV